MSLTPETLREFLDKEINLWRSRRDSHDEDGSVSDYMLKTVAIAYADAYQEVRERFLGSRLEEVQNG